jgi:predicted anti-sigma-YlaC factor YlaD
VQRARQPDRGERPKWARWALGAVGVLLLAAGTFVSAGWPILILGFIVVVGAATRR